MSNDTTPSWQDILDLVIQLDGGNYDTAAVEFGNVSVQLSRTGNLTTAPAPAPATVPSSTATAPASDSETHEQRQAGTIIPAPMIGVFYRCPSPGAPPFVEVGARVEPDTTVGIIEVMKLMNPVVAGVSGTLVEVLAKDSEQVEYGQPIAVVDESGTS
ncbi:acetyl-CoA carboxylase biotin carboxyl carrier protein [Rhodococcus sp. IEGM 1330]|uniref:acetyl-CoA carboxylase biotin carboxyl carrier protein n=1 Tax=Rhodococcus sp. IEGM 1330 TaxID=3082225 RepID=UPI002952ACF1|nr:biotin/lipoyl-containing protein [Rhodococcus sp. IEGM 1330]MDV8022722.1 biotin/lipoyl-containing protein [Rhodococcus sp. IEGM 1330]